jgi:hypothetical protein
MLNTGKYYLPNLELDFFSIKPDEFNELFSSKFVIIDLSGVKDNKFFLMIAGLLIINFFDTKKMFLIKDETISKVDSIDINLRNDCIIYGCLDNRHYAFHFKNLYSGTEAEQSIDTIVLDEKDKKFSGALSEYISKHNLKINEDITQ